MKQGYGMFLNNWIEDKSIKTELRLLLKISSLTAIDGICFASNEYFAKYFDTTPITISRQIKKLEKLNYIKINYIMRGAEVKRREIRLTKMITDDYQKRQSSINKNDNRTINKNVKDNIISNNTISNNKAKLIFRNSIYHDFDTLRNYFLNKKEYVKKYAGADLKYYIEQVEIWSDKKGKLTTNRGWLAYIRQFMNSDLENDKLHLKKKSAKTDTEKLKQLRKEGRHVNF